MISGGKVAATHAPRGVGGDGRDGSKVITYVKEVHAHNPGR